MKKLCLYVSLMVLFTGTAQAEVFVILNDDNSINTVSGKNDTVLQEGQRVVMYQGKLGDFCDSLPAHPSLCRLVGKEYVYDETLVPSPKFDAQACEGELYTSFIPTLSAEDLALLQANESMLIITRCFDYDNAEAWTTLKLHLASLVQQGLSSDAVSSFKQIVKNNHYDIGGE